jgi:hypothetical protein
MTENKVYNKLVNLAMQEISFSEFQELLFSSTESNPIRIGWQTLEGNNRYYWCFWDSAAYVGNKASQTKQAEDMVNLQVMDLVGDWRTIDYTSVSKCRYNGQTFKVI